VSTALILLLALLLDGAFGEPKWLWSRIPHPAVVMGRAVGWMDDQFNTGDAKTRNGTLSLIALCAGAGILGLLVSSLPDFGITQTLLTAFLLAQKSLTQHVTAVANALRLSVGDGRLAVAQIVGRDTRDMNESAIARGAIESAAENLSDGVIAPAFWFLLLGLPGLLIYKITNTADSMIGYMTPRHREFGWAAAKFDDLVNWIPARITAFLIALTHGTLSKRHLILRDAPLHRSPNAGWPESAMAVALDVALAGPRSYDNEMRDFPFVHEEGRHTLTANDVDSAAAALWRTWCVVVFVTAFVALFN